MRNNSKKRLSGAQWREKLDTKDWAEMCERVKKELFIAWFAGEIPWPIPEGHVLAVHRLQYPVTEPKPAKREEVNSNA